MLPPSFMAQRSARRVGYLTTTQVRRFFRAIPASDLRDRTLFALTYRYGLRRKEAAWLKRTDIDPGRIWITREKGGISHEYPLDEELARLLSRYRRTLGGVTPYLFPGTLHPLGPISPSTIYARFRRTAARAGLPAPLCHPHVLRHSVATHLLTAGWDLIDVQDWLGHRSIASTAIYTRVTSKRRAEAFRAAMRSGEIARLR